MSEKQYLLHQFQERNSLSTIQISLLETEQYIQQDLPLDHLLLSNHFQHSPRLAWLDHREEPAPSVTKTYSMVNTNTGWVLAYVKVQFQETPWMLISCIKQKIRQLFSQLYTITRQAIYQPPSPQALGAKQTGFFVAEGDIYLLVLKASIELRKLQMKNPLIRLYLYCSCIQMINTEICFLPFPYSMKKFLT